MSDDDERSAVDAALDACGKAARMLAVGAIDAAQHMLMAAADAFEPTLRAHAMRQAEIRAKEREERRAAERQPDGATRRTTTRTLDDEPAASSPCEKPPTTPGNGAASAIGRCRSVGRVMIGGGE